MVAGRSVWRERQLVVLIALVACTHFTRLDTLTLRGEETRRAQVAAEMLASGDWIVPRQQGTIYLSRPPLGNWLIAAAASARGELDAIAIRLPSVLAVLLTTLLIYVYSRDFLGRAPALLAAAAYPTMGQVLQIGRLGETEGVFTLLVSSSLLLWHRGLCRNWPLGLTWSTGYVLAALAGLAKGPQGPIYFLTATWLYLLLRGDWKRFWHGGHLLGLLAFAICLGSWQWPYYARTDWASVCGIWTGNALDRYHGHTFVDLLRHVATYPLEILICTLPWSLVLRQYFRPSFYANLQGAAPAVLFAAVCLLATFPSVWFAEGAKSRYFMPLYPLIAVLVGAAAEFCLSARPGTVTRRHWNQLLLGGAAVGAAGSLFLLIVPRIDAAWAARATVPWGNACGLLCCAVCVAVAAWFAARNDNPRRAETAILAFAGMFGWAYVGPVITAKAQVMNDLASAVRQVESQLPPDARLVSLGVVSHRFRHFYSEPIDHVPWPPAADQSLPEFEYFCFGELPLSGPIDFEWEPVAEVCIDRNSSSQQNKQVIVGRRLAPTSVAKQSAASRLE